MYRPRRNSVCADVAKQHGGELGCRFAGPAVSAGHRPNDVAYGIEPNPARSSGALPALGLTPEVNHETYIADR